MTGLLDPGSIRERVGDLSQVAGAREVRLSDGSEDGVRALDVRILGGIQTLVLLDRGMDLGPAWYGGFPLSWQSPTGIVHPSYFRDDTWLRSFHGGLLVTCGLQNVGPENVDEGTSHGLHGRISNTPARNVTWRLAADERGLAVEVEGEVREADVYGADLILRRRLRFPIGEARIEIADEVENRGFDAAALMLLYHFNIGYPVVDDGAQLRAPEATIVGRDDAAQARVAEHASFQPPERDFPALVYEHRLKDPGAAQATIGVLNERSPAAGAIGVAVSYAPQQLQRLWQWRMLAPGMYLAGLEPANCGIRGRAEERAAGDLDYLEPGERRTFTLTVRAAVGAAAKTLFR
jgi:hypothetical protein